MIMILASQTVGRINLLTGWGLTLITGLLTVRAINDIVSRLDDPEVNLRDAIRMSKKRLYAALIAITVESLVVYIQSFYC